MANSQDVPTTEQFLDAIADIFGNNHPNEQPAIDLEARAKIDADTYRAIMKLNDRGEICTQQHKKSSAM